MIDPCRILAAVFKALVTAQAGNPGLRNSNRSLSVRGPGGPAGSPSMVPNVISTLRTRADVYSADRGRIAREQQ
jgi:hypothetical protein